MGNCALVLLLCLAGVTSAISAADPNQSRDRPDGARKSREPPSKTAGDQRAPLYRLTRETRALLRVIIRQDMAGDREAGETTRSDLTKERAVPLAWTSGDPRERKRLRAIMADEASDPYKRFNAARVAAYLGDSQSIDILSQVFQGKLVKSDSGREQNQAALCLLFLDCQFPKDFAFNKLPSPLYPELDALIDRPIHRVHPTPPYTEEEVEAIIVKYMRLPFFVDVRGPLSVTEWEKGPPSDIDRDVSRDRFPWIRPGSRILEGFRRQLQQGDLIYFFRSDKTSWAGLYGREGYVAIRGGEIVACAITRFN
jgi:hypothetical protein